MGKEGIEEEGFEMTAAREGDLEGGRERARVMQATELLRVLVGYIKPLESAAVAFSGGVDSTLVLFLAARTLGAENVLAVTAVSETLPSRELEQAKALAAEMGVPHSLVETAELENEDFSSNPPERCFYCKSELWSHVRRLADEKGLKNMLDGVNMDDTLDDRPGIRASDEAGVVHPLAALGINKEGMRMLARELGLPNWDKPAQACLSSRFPYGQRITPEALKRVEEAESFLHGLDLGQLRVRDHGGIARIEVPPDRIGAIVAEDNRSAIVAKLKELGYTYVAIDLEGFRSGSMNEGRSQDGG